MKKNIWIWNHYATNMFDDRAGRHYWFAENLIKEGYNPVIFCASTYHNSNKKIETNNQKYIIKEVNDIPFVFVNTPDYQGNGKKRLKNMIAFYKGLYPVAKDYAKKYGKPDVILASSVHPLTLIAGIKIAKKFGVPCICEIRDLWPESIVAYGILKRNSILAKILYRGEKWIYKKADSIIMTWEGGSQYIIDRGWDNQIDLNKIKYISNGVLVDDFDKNGKAYEFIDLDLDDKSYKNLIYTGSIRKVNNLGLLLDAAKVIQQHDSKIRFLIYGSGDERKILEKRCKDEDIKNFIFKGHIEKKLIPSILKKSYANILHNSSTTLDIYGQSQNKFFEYLAAGKCIIQTYTTGYSLCEKYNCGVSSPQQTPKEIAKTIMSICNNEEMSKQMGYNARKAVFNHDFRNLTRKLVELIESV